MARRLVEAGVDVVATEFETEAIGFEFVDLPFRVSAAEE